MRRALQSHAVRPVVRRLLEIAQLAQIPERVACRLAREVHARFEALEEREVAHGILRSTLTEEQSAGFAPVLSVVTIIDSTPFWP